MMDLVGYEKYLNGELSDYEYPESEIQENLKKNGSLSTSTLINIWFIKKGWLLHNYAIPLFLNDEFIHHL